MDSSWPVEREIKLRVGSRDEAVTRARAAGAVAQGDAVLQDDTLFDDAERTLAHRGCALRVRRQGDATILTFKGPQQPAVMKIRDEVETHVASGPAIVAILGGAGLKPVFRYQKRRQQFALRNALMTLDETPIGVFVELEGDEEAVRAGAAALGFRPADYIRSSYATLYRQYCRERGLEPGNMLFESDTD